MTGRSALLVFGAHGYGGTELVFARLAQYLSEKGLNVSVDSEAGAHFVRQLLGKIAVGVERGSHCNYDYVVCSGIHVARLRELSDAGTNAKRAIVWTLGESGLLENLAVGYGIRFRLGPKGTAIFTRLYSLLLRGELARARSWATRATLARGLYFTDGVGLKVTLGKEANFEVGNDCILPVPVPRWGASRASAAAGDISSGGNGLRIGWLGRLSYDFKVYPLIATMRRAVDYCRRRRLPLRFSIIGDGEARGEIEQLAVSLASAGVSIKVHGFMPSIDAVRILETEVDLAIGMGTAALDAASVGVASAIVNPATSRGRSGSVAYRWLYESRDHSLGEFVELGNAPSQPMRSFDELADNFLANRNSVVRDCAAYVQQHYIDVVFERLVDELDRIGTCMDDLCHGLREIAASHRRSAAILRMVKQSLRRRNVISQ